MSTRLEDFDIFVEDEMSTRSESLKRTKTVNHSKWKTYKLDDLDNIDEIKKKVERIMGGKNFTTDNNIMGGEEAE